MIAQLDRHVQETREFINELAANLGHPEEEERTARLLKAFLHVLRDRMIISESLDLLAQLPMFLKAMYVDQWKYKETPDKFTSAEELIEKVKAKQSSFGEHDFPWKKPTGELIQIVFTSLRKYLTEGEIEHIMAQMPKDVQDLLSQKEYAS